MDLIRRPEGFWVPKEYDFWDEEKPILDEYLREDFGTSPPSFCFDREFGKLRLDFSSGDNIVSLARRLSYFFDTKEELILFLWRDYTKYEANS